MQWEDWQRNCTATASICPRRVAANSARRTTSAELGIHAFRKELESWMIRTVFLSTTLTPFFKYRPMAKEITRQHRSCAGTFRNYLHNTGCSRHHTFIADHSHTLTDPSVSDRKPQTPRP
jgi:hypothetical protein